MVWRGNQMAGGTPQIIIHILLLDSTLNKPSIWGTPILGNIHVYKYIRKYRLHTHTYVYIFIYVYLLLIYFSWNPWSKSKSADSSKNEWFDDRMPAMHLPAVNWQTSIAKMVDTNYNNSNDPNMTTTNQWSCQIATTTVIIIMKHIYSNYLSIMVSLLYVVSPGLITGWWFGTCVLFPCWECHHPNWLSHIFQRGRYTTNQITIMINHY